MNRIILLGLILILLTSCKKDIFEKTTKEKLTGTWRFKEIPARLTNSWQGRCCEDRTIFSGEEHLSFIKNGDFKIDTTTYGFWEMDSLENIIIDMTSSGGYAVGDFIATQVHLEIIELNDTMLKVDHSFYIFNPNYYVLEPDK